MRRNWLESLKAVGPGFAVAATGVGAGDIVAASVAGAKYGTVVLWAAVLGALIKYALNEGISRWQLATGTTVLEGWRERFHPFVSFYFLVYLILWSLIVAAALSSACGLAAHAMNDSLSVTGWAIAHSVTAVIIVLFGRYALFERLMKLFTGVMFATIILCALLVRPDWISLILSLVVPTIPEGSGKFLIGVMGGVGGSVTLLSYGYWIREKNWKGREYIPLAKLDLGIAYCFTGMFAVAMMIIAAGVQPSVISGDTMALEVARRVEEVIGPVGKWSFLFGFWGAVFTSVLGVWQGIPYLFADFMFLREKRMGKATTGEALISSRPYRGFLMFLAFPPLLLLLFDRPVWIIIIYAITGAFFMPFLAVMLLVMNNRADWVGQSKNGWTTNALLRILAPRVRLSLLRRNRRHSELN